MNQQAFYLSRGWKYGLLLITGSRQRYVIIVQSCLFPVLFIQKQPIARVTNARKLILSIGKAALMGTASGKGSERRKKIKLIRFMYILFRVTFSAGPISIQDLYMAFLVLVFPSMREIKPYETFRNLNFS